MLAIRTLKYSKNFRTKLSSQSILQQSTAIQPVTENKNEDFEKTLKTFETITNVTKRIRTKKPNRPPFAKNLFLGKFDNEILTYPQLENEDVVILENETSKLKKLLQQPHMVKCKSLSEKSFRQNLSDYKAIGLQAPQLLNARECNLTESFMFLETVCEHSLAQSLVTHECQGVNILVTFADDILKKKYLPPLLKGESLIALCLNETDCVDINSFETNAKLSQDQKQWVLNGTKRWVFNGSLANYFIIFATTETKNVNGSKKGKLTAFFVHKDAPGVTIQEHDISGINVADVTFKDTPVAVDHIIGKVNTGDQMLQLVVTENRLAFGPMCISLSKKILNNLVKEILDRSNDSNRLHKTDIIRAKIAEIVISIYAMESMVYLTTGLGNNYENQDIDVESALVKVFCSERLHQISLESLDILGTVAASNSHWANELHRETIKYLTLHECNGVLKIMLSLLGLQHAGKVLKEEVQKMRNPFFNPFYNINRIWTARRDENDDPKLNLFLQEHLHPALLNSALSLDYCVQRLRYGSEQVLVNYGSEVINYHIDLERLANCVLNIYAMTSILGRASRSYCIGLQHADMEMMIANSYCNYAIDRVKENVNNILVEHLRTDTTYKMIAKRTFKFKQYCLEHPLKRNF